ncbi:ATP11 protein-domain-containing protein, partial [Phaeosphaeriaceae sp. PMI808]
RLGLANVDQLQEKFRHSGNNVLAAFERAGGVQFAGPTPVPVEKQTPDSIKKLGAFLDLKRVRSLGWSEIEMVWRLRHASSESSLCATIPASTYGRIAETARAHPCFVLPLLAHPQTASLNEVVAEKKEDEKRQGVTLHYVEWAFPTLEAATVMITQLDEFKRQGKFAVPHTSATLHLELAKSNDVVLLQGQVAEDKGIGSDEAQLLIMLIQKFYAAEMVTNSGRRRLRLLQQFTEGSKDFDVGELVKEAEMAE